MGLSEISQTEMESWDGPKHYVSIQHVNKPNNKSTKMKLVINSSLVELASDKEPANASPRVRDCLICQHCVNET